MPLRRTRLQFSRWDREQDREWREGYGDSGYCVAVRFRPAQASRLVHSKVSRISPRTSRLGRMRLLEVGEPQTPDLRNYEATKPLCPASSFSPREAHRFSS